MTKHIIDGRKIQKKILVKVEKQVLKLKNKNITPKLVVILVGDDKPSQTYVRKKGQTAQKIGINFLLKKFPKKIKEEDLVENLLKIQMKHEPDGLIVQLPLPKHLNQARILNTVQTQIDIDCLTNENMGRLTLKNKLIDPPTPGAVLEILKNLKINLKGKNVVIIGSGILVGRPLSLLLMDMGATVTVCNSSTKNLKERCLNSDIIVSGAGKKHIVTQDMVNENTIVIDAGVSFEKNKMYGDVDAKNVAKVAKYVTPTPGGVGPITIAKLLENLIILTNYKT
jgi:methylenetetrahydrofolate dehydrogenase (NADP+)/methenyltetrahydrofolate cyclohydrolase